MYTPLTFSKLQKEIYTETIRSMEDVLHSRGVQGLSKIIGVDYSGSKKKILQRILNKVFPSFDHDNTGIPESTFLESDLESSSISKTSLISKFALKDEIKDDQTIFQDPSFRIHLSFRSKTGMSGKVST